MRSMELDVLKGFKFFWETSFTKLKNNSFVLFQLASSKSRSTLSNPQIAKLIFWSGKNTFKTRIFFWITVHKLFNDWQQCEVTQKANLDGLLDCRSLS